jgi:hypothetical protein
MPPYAPMRTLLFLLLTLPALAQRTDPAAILARPRRAIAAYDTAAFGATQLAIRFPYGSPRVLNAGDYAAIKGLKKVTVEYIYTKYTLSQPDQVELDRDRFAALEKLAPDLFDDPSIRWEVLVQTAALRAPEAQKLFHGFVITYERFTGKGAPEGEGPTTKREVKTRLDRFIDCTQRVPPKHSPTFPGGEAALADWIRREIKFPSDAVQRDSSWSQATVEFKIDLVTGLPKNVRVTGGASLRHNEHLKAVWPKMPRWSKGNPGVVFSVDLRFERVAGGKTNIRVGALRGYDPRDCGGQQPDSTITQVLRRNPKWKNMLVVEDVTGSMMPYVADLLLYNALKANLDHTRHFVFFNDGDRKEDVDKVIGETGGIYHAAAPLTVEKLEETMIAAIAGGSGGDKPENDLEAVLAGLKACPSCGDVVLISDNRTTPRDLMLLERVGRPLHIILCGVDEAHPPNAAHLYLAWKTGGSVHTLTEDVTRLAALKEGDTIAILGMKYKVRNGRIVPLKYK